MRKIIYIAIVLTVIGFFPVIQQETTGCSAFGYDHLASSAVITTADSCSTGFLAIPLIPSVQISRLLSFDSAYIHYFFIGITSILTYTLIGYIAVKIKKYNIS